jgi:hypothetical protein
MDFHDYHLRGYEVAEFGSVITLDLVYEYPGQVVRKSRIRFEGVKLYHFVHTVGAIITDIEEVSLNGLVREHEASISAWSKEQGVADWRTDTDQLLEDWSALSLKAWCIDSAIGFKGFVVATSVA